MKTSLPTTCLRYSALIWGLSFLRYHVCFQVPFAWTVLKCSGKVWCVCMHPARVAVGPWLKCRVIYGFRAGWIWVQGWVGTTLPSPPPPAASGQHGRGFPPAGGRLRAVCKALSAREAAVLARLGHGDHCVQGLSCHCAADLAGTRSSWGLWPCWAAAPAHLPRTNAVRTSDSPGVGRC